MMLSAPRLVEKIFDGREIAGCGFAGPMAPFPPKYVIWPTVLALTDKEPFQDVRVGNGPG
jgi:hypothetical protein